MTSLLLQSALCLALTAPGPATDIRFEYEDGRIYVPVSTVAHGKPVALGWFILDTGAGQICIDRALARRLGLTVNPGGTQTGAGSGASAFGMTKGIALRVDGVALTPSSIVVVPLDSVLAPVSGRAVSGIVGSQFFHEHAVELDRGRNLLRVDPRHVATGADLPAAERRAYPFVFQDDAPVIEAKLVIPGAATSPTPVRLLVDLGAKAPLLLTGPFLERIGGEPRLGPHVLASLGAGIGGETRYWFTRVGALTLGRDAVLAAPALVAGFSALGTLRSTEYDGLLGAPLLDHDAVLFDYARRLIWLAPRGNGVAPPDPLTAFDRAGLFLVTRPGGGAQQVFVQRVIAGSPAAEAGIAEGDEVTSLDGRPVLGMRLSALRATLRSRATISARLGVKHGGATSVRLLTLRDLL